MAAVANHFVALLDGDDRSSPGSTANSNLARRCDSRGMLYASYYVSLIIISRLKKKSHQEDLVGVFLFLGVSIIAFKYSIIW